MPEETLSIGSAIWRSWRYWIVEVGAWAAGFTAGAVLYSAFMSASGPFSLIYTALVAFPMFAVLGALLRVGAQGLVLHRMQREFDFRLSVATYEPKSFAQKLVSGEFRKLYKQMQEERAHGLR